jgi:geranylgeranyl diphosphate synthase type II
MDGTRRIETVLAAAVASVEGPRCPPGLAAAVQHAVFPGGARIRPRLCMAVAGACGNPESAVADAAGASIELLHCASLVHDDLPCFDDAATRRGRPSVHRAFGERLAVLAGDALIVLAFQTLARWECESEVALDVYQQEKTGSLFTAAAVAGAQAVGADGAPWRLFGDRLGEAYQVADDIRDVLAEPEDLGKPCGRDAALHRPSAAQAFGTAGAIAHFRRLVNDSIEAIPACRGSAQLRALILLEAQRLLPEQLTRRAA